MDEMANIGSRRQRDSVKAQLYADQFDLVARLDREIEQLRQLAPPGYEQTIAELEEAMLAIHDAIGRLRATDRR